MKIITKKEFLSGIFDEFITKEINKGNVIIFPSESSYGLAANATNKKVIKKIHLIKKESENKPLGVITDKISKIKKYINFGKNGEKLLTKTKKPLTILFEIKTKIPTSTNNFLGVRIPTNTESVALCKLVDFPLTATSANLHGSPNIYSSKLIKETFNDTKFIFIDAGELKINPPSTYYNYKTKQIIRAGEIDITEILNILGEK